MAEEAIFLVFRSALSAPFIRRLCMKLSTENWIRIDASSNRTRLRLFISWRNLLAPDEGMQGLRTWEEDSLGGVDDSITNYVLHPLFFFFFCVKGKKFDPGCVDTFMQIGIELSGRRWAVKYDMEFGYIFSLRCNLSRVLRYRAFPSIR